MSPAQFLGRLKRGVPPAVLLLGSEGYERQRVRRALSDAHLGPNADEATTLHDLAEVSLREVIDDARSLSLFVSSRLIRVISAELVLPRATAPSDEDSDEDDGDSPATTAGALAAYLKDPAPGVVLLFEATRFALDGEEKKKAERVRKFYAAVSEVVELERYTPDAARRELDSLAQRAGIRFEPAAAQLLVEALGADISRIATELEKLALYASATHAISVADIAALIPDARSNTIFALVAALGRRDRSTALAVLDTLCRDGEYLPLSLSFLSTQMRLALMAQQAGVKTAQQVQAHFSRSGVPMWPSRAEQVAQTIGRFSADQLRRGLKLLFRVDRDLRSARPDDRIVMEEFVMQLTE